MKLIEKLKNVFFEEVPEDEDEEELPQTFAKKIEVPKKPVEVPKVQEYHREERQVYIPEPEDEIPVPGYRQRRFCQIRFHCTALRRASHRCRHPDADRHAAEGALWLLGLLECQRAFPGAGFPFFRGRGLVL